MPTRIYLERICPRLLVERSPANKETSNVLYLDSHLPLYCSGQVEVQASPYSIIYIPIDFSLLSLTRQAIIRRCKEGQYVEKWRSTNF